MNQTAQQQAQNFIDNETEFHLGFLPTEQSNPLTRNLDREFADSPQKGIRCLQRADREVLTMARRILVSAEFNKIVEAGINTLRNGGRIVFSGCGATGRLSILLESMWREFFVGRDDQTYADSVYSIMTGGDYALIRSVEFFEDYQAFGRRQAADLGMNQRDMLVAITEGGETSSVIGTVKEAAERGGAVFLLFNNPAELLRTHLIRCREVIDDPRVTVLDLCCGPMSVAGSTRMQATTSEQLIAGALLETLIARLYPAEFPEPIDFAAGFETVLTHLESEAVVSQIADYLNFEVATYQKHGKITYFAAEYLLDIFTDTTERSPTFMLPPFKRSDDPAAVPSWAFVKDPRFGTAETWENMLRRKPRCIEWTPDDYRSMNAEEKIIARPPMIDPRNLYKMQVGNEAAPERSNGSFDAAVKICVTGAARNRDLDQAFAVAAADYPIHRELCVSSGAIDTPLHLLNHMAIKLVLNNISTGVMTCLGRVTGNWMSWVDISNKKLIDRAIRLIAELGALSYRDACFALFDAVDEMNRQDWSNREKPSPVQYTLEKVGRKA